MFILSLIAIYLVLGIVFTAQDYDDSIIFRFCAKHSPALIPISILCAPLERLTKRF